MAVPAPFGSEFQVNVTTSSGQDTPSVAAFKNGMFVAVWEDDNNGGGNEVRARVYHADGTPATAEIFVNQTTTGNQRTPVVAALTDGAFVVAFEDNSGGTKDIKARVFDLDGSPAAVNGGNQFTVNAGATASTQQEPAIAALTGGGFVIAWSTDDIIPGDFDISARAFSVTGAPVADAFSIVALGSDETQPAVTGLSNGNWAIAWADSASGVHGDIRSPDGSSAPAANHFFTINTGGPGAQPSLAGLPNGTFVATWTEDQAIWGRTVPNNGFAPGGALSITGLAGLSEFDPAITALAGGGHVEVWVDPNAGDGSGTHIRGLVNFGAGGQQQFVINTGNKAGNQIQPTVAGLTDGRFVVMWVDPGQTPGSADVSGNGICAHIFDPRTSAVTLIGSDLGDEFIGTAFGDTMDGGNGNDLLRGMSGKDTLFGNAGNDILDGGADADTMKGAAGNDTYVVDNAGDIVDESAAGSSGADTIVSSISFSLGGIPTAKGGEVALIKGGIEKLTLAGSAANATGNALGNKLVGNAVANVLDGDDGNDTLAGGGAADAFIFDVKPNKTTNIDHITDFAPGVDQIRLDASVFKGLKIGALKAKAFYAHKNADEAKDGTDRIVYDTKSGELRWDKDGKGGVKAKLFGDLDGSPDVDGRDFLVVA